MDASFFTGQVKQAIICGRCGTLCDPEKKPSTYITGPDGTGRHCCPECTTHYQTKWAALSKAREDVQKIAESKTTKNHGGDRSTPLWTQAQSAAMPAIAAIAKASNTAQRASGHGISVQRIGMGLPAAPARNGLQIHVPGMQHLSFNYSPMSTSASRSAVGTRHGGVTAGFGYTNSHANYQNARAEVAGKAYARQLQPNVTVHTALHVRKSDGTGGTRLIKDIEEGVMVQVNITQQDLKRLIFDKLAARWAVYYPKNTLQIETLELVTDKLVRLDEGAGSDAPLLPFFYRLPANPKSHAGDKLQPKFYPSTSLKLRLLVPRDVYHRAYQRMTFSESEFNDPEDEVLDIVQESISGAMTANVGSDMVPYSSTPACALPPAAKRGSDKGLTKNDTEASTVLVPSSRARSLSESLGDPEVASKKTRLSQDQDSVSHQASERIIQLRHSRPEGVESARAWNEDARHHNVAGNLLSEPAARQPWQELNLSALTEMLGRQGEVRRSAQQLVLIGSAKYLLHPVPHDTLTTIINASKPRLFDLSEAHCPGYAVQLTVDLKKEHKLGKAGGFKTAHPAVIHVDQQTLKEIGPASILSHPNVAAKRCFFRQDSIVSGTYKTGIQRYAQKDELPKMAVEANCIYWASALMDLVYSFIDKVLASKELTEEDLAAQGLTIPRMRFVYAALAVPVDDQVAPIYLLEELIREPFIKFIVNNSVEPSAAVASDKEHYNIALFLCCAQHVQYVTTGKMAMVSDFQGSRTLLTDPQIMTTQQFAFNFADGNLPRILDQFAVSHKCNKFCKLLDLTDLQEDRGAEANEDLQATKESSSE